MKKNTHKWNVRRYQIRKEVNFWGLHILGTCLCCAIVMQQKPYNGIWCTKAFQSYMLPDIVWFSVFYAAKLEKTLFIEQNRTDEFLYSKRTKHEIGTKKLVYEMVYEYVYHCQVHSVDPHHIYLCIHDFVVWHYLQFARISVKHSSTPNYLTVSIRRSTKLLKRKCSTKFLLPYYCFCEDMCWYLVLKLHSCRLKWLFAINNSNK